ncbi:GAK system ATP-grasp enzyme [Desulfovibrio sulfodismutans]|uniref:GAK system ATP-grasp enzyme n=1 Tax=Desulfolutivibrio sulfodismutans TaxID=63561 RepID=A0A7K3NM44_9BACT|nr:GAK system ATP-grasp enzyme [Desulfolutivibrio sulfodismutans]NDY57187.1 GAK system ATP-grasp enzyme [Desulfolutivibrio sulfodismutans]QLA11821.1 GAK system ATP-grasp enzyme [Desulfolutivibrio sulfodismutans DSM 3696]
MKRVGVVGIPKGWSTLQLVDALAQRGVTPILIDMARARLDLATRTVWHAEVEMTALDAVIVKKIAPTYSPDALDRMDILRFVSARGVPVFSDPDSMYRLIDRLGCTTALRLGDIPMPPTTITEDVDEALAAVENYGRAVFKPLYSSKARGMTVIETGSAAREEIEDFQAAGNRVMYIQRMVSHAGGHLDLGVSFLGGKYLATYARQGDGNSWDTTTRTGGKYVPYEPGAEIVALAEKAQALFPGMAFTCVDVVETPDGAAIYEVSAFGGFRGLLDACGLDAAGLYADYVLERIA